MDTRLTSIEWREQAELMSTLLSNGDLLIVETLNQGFEAEVIKLSFNEASFVLKVWNKDSNPNIEMQYRLLKMLSEQGFAVSKPIGWGLNSSGDKVLLTTYDGETIKEVNAKMFSKIAGILSQLHQISIAGGDYQLLPKYDLIAYFYPGISEHLDLFDALTQLVELAQIKQDRFIHGDYHFENIVDNGGHFTVIDWTNAQLGDSRYDFAWSLILNRIYLNPGQASVFCSTYLQHHSMQQEELDLFEALACIRWMLLNRRGGVPRRANTLEKVKKLISNNSFLRKYSFSDFPIKKIILEADAMNMSAIFDRFPVMNSTSLVLKRIEVGHLDEVFEIYSNDKVFEYCGIIPKHNKETVNNMIVHFERDYKKRTKVKWGIFTHQESEKLIGILEAFDFNVKVGMATIGYFLAESAWGKGIATEAVHTLAKYLFEEVNVNRIQAEVMPVNDASKGVLLKNGFMKEGTIRQASIWSGKGIVDLEIYGMLKRDYVGSED